MVASGNGHPSVVRTLLRAGATVNTTTQVGYTLYSAVMFGVVCTCAWKCLSVLNTHSHSHKTHTHAHMHTHDTHTYAHMSYTHIHKHECAQNRQTALYFAADRGHEDVVDLLLEANADSDLSKKVVQMYQTILYSV